MTSMAFMMRFYNNAAKIFGAKGVLCRRLEILGRNLVYKACGSGCIITTSAWVYFFEKSFRVPKIVPKVLVGIAYRNLLFYVFAFNRFVLLLKFI